ncbi:MAG: transketolase [Treponema sp.]|jgi:transketolase|nr:transketolase [Treponema sp.]
MFKDLEDKALDLRRRIVTVSKISGAGHITSSLSSVDILNALYNGSLLRFNSKVPDWGDRDRFILSKGHATLALYNVLCDVGFVRQEDVNTFCQKGSKFGGLTTTTVPGVECYTGSLGHGLSFAVGVALHAKVQKADYLTYVLSGDGECQEGSIWEAAMSITHFNLTNLIWIIDKNNIQLSGKVDDIMNLESIEDKLKAFGFITKTINGHKYEELFLALKFSRENPPSKPIAIICNTVKGKGVPFLENKLNWHGRKPSVEEHSIITEQLGMQREERMEE